MSARYHRAQLLLEPEQHENIRRIAARESRSISDVVRQLITIGLEVLANDEQARSQQRETALDQLTCIREAVRERYGVYQGNLVAEARSEREQGLDRARRDGS